MFRDQPLYQDSLASRHHCHNILMTRLQGLSSISPQVFSLNRVHGLYLKHLLNLGWIHPQDTIMTGMPFRNAWQHALPHPPSPQKPLHLAPFTGSFLHITNDTLTLLGVPDQMYHLECIGSLQHLVIIYVQLTHIYKLEVVPSCSNMVDIVGMKP